MKILFAVPYIEVEYGWGEHSEGYKVFDNLEQCINTTQEESMNGNFPSGGGGYFGPERYFGPVRPLHYYETPDEIPGPFPKFVDKIKFKSNSIRIGS